MRLWRISFKATPSGVVSFENYHPPTNALLNPYLDRWYNHMPLLDAMQTVSRKAFKRAFVGG